MLDRVVPLARSPVTGGPVSLFVRDVGEGPPLVLLHGGWGHGYYPWDLGALAGFRVLAPDRAGYGRSTPLPGDLPRGFHQAMAEETRALLDALGVARAHLWGHSDGAVIALRMALDDPARFPRVVAEATHVWKRKPASRAFFAGGERPDAFPGLKVERMEADHGARWRDVPRAGGRAWLALADEATRADEDLYGGRLAAMRADVLLLHGARDPRTEPGEFEALRKTLPRAEVAWLEQGGHCPHAERAVRDEATRRAVAFLRP